jgi:hypothetical protein
VYNDIVSIKNKNMDFFSTSTWIIIGVISAAGVIIAPIVQVVWIMRFLMASYVAFCLVILMPENMMFNVYASSVFFLCFLIIFTLVEKGRFFDVTEWMAGRFSFQVFGLGVLTVFFLSAIACNLLAFSHMESFMTKEIYDIFVKYVFYFAIAPLLFSILFAKRL